MLPEIQGSQNLDPFDLLSKIPHPLCTTLGNFLAKILGHNTVHKRVSQNFDLGFTFLFIDKRVISVTTIHRNWRQNGGI